MNREQLVSAVAEKANAPKAQVERTIAAFMDVVKAEVAKGGKVQLVGFGTFELRERAAREGRNPATGEAIHIEAKKAPAFKVGKAFKDAVNA